MKHLILFFLIGLMGYSPTVAQWEQLSEPKGGHILDLTTHNGAVYISVANQIYKSTDNGLTWEKSRGNLPEISDINSIGGTESALYAGVNDAGTGQKMFVSYDGGVNWSETGGKGATILGIDWENIGDTAFVMTNFGHVMRTKDNGATFEDLAKASIGHSIDVWGQDLFYVGQGLVRMSTNRGDSVSAPIGTSPVIQFRFGAIRTAIRIDTVLLAGGPGVFKLDSDAVWNYSSDGMPKSNGTPTLTVSKLAVAGELLWAFTNEGIYVSADTANTWSLVENSPITGFVQRVKLKENTFHIAAQNGYFISNGALDTTITFEQRVDGLNHVSLAGVEAIGAEIFAYGPPTGIIKSSDNGTSFVQFGGNLSANSFTDVTLSGDTYFAIVNSTLYSSTDGNEWLKVDTAPNMFAVEAYNDTLFASGGSQVYKSQDKGNSWIVVAPNFKLGSSAPTSYAFHDSVIFGGFRNLNVFGSIARSLDGGENWEITSGAGSLTISAEIVFIGDTAYAPVITTFKGGGVARSVNFGESWELMTNNLNDEVGGAYELEVEGTTLYTISLNGMWKSIDGARNWESVEISGLPTTVFYSGSPFKIHNGYMYYAPYNNGIYKKETGGMSTSNSEESEIAVTFKLHQNYPNPFNPSTNINFSLPNAGSVSLKVYNILGQEVATLVDQQMGTGNHAVSFDASRLSSGVYIYRLQAGGKVQTKKMLLVK